ncbi:MAG: Xaa-Pro aminopeptidase [Actinobacteria bacterium]|jgi:Xaa-Pro aminopeptidase|nr:Xaa-Pro aminopeptidase [Actinomycetota bacterium]
MEEKTAESRRVYDVPPSDVYADFMTTGWAPSPLHGITQDPVISFCFARRAKLSEAFAGLRIIIPSGNSKVRSNDTDYRFRPHSAFVYYTGVQGEEVTSDAVLVMEPNGEAHDSILYIQPRSTRDTSAFYNDRKYGELWVGRRYTTDEASVRFGIEVRKVDTLKKLLKDGTPAVALSGFDALVDSVIKKNPRGGELENFVSVARLIKDEHEINELQKSVDVTHRGFNDVIRSLPAAVVTPRGERVVEAAFYGRARIEGNELGYDTISAAGSHACVLHWTRNDGDVKNGDLLLLDAGVELDSYYTADITRTLPINGKFSPAQRSLYMLVCEAQKAGFAAIRPGVDFLEINKACHTVLAQGLVDLGILTISAEESMRPEVGLHRRWTLHGVSHMLGLDVHDCAQARKDQYTEAKLEAGMVLTVEPGLYIQPDDELFPPEYRGIGIRIEDDVLVTETGYFNLSENIPRHPDAIEAWMASLLK